LYTSKNMSPPGQVGRPKNAWSLSRKRKLVRLYCLTTLDKTQISKILEASDFGPRYGHLFSFWQDFPLADLELDNSESDIQKKLRYLLPKDYAKDHRRFRPTDEANMRLRLQILQICESKSPKRPSKLPRHITSLADARFCKRKTIYEVEGAYSAFRNYGTFSATSTHIPLAPPAPTSISTTPPSQLVNPFLIMLDGSIVADTLSSKEPESGCISNSQVLSCLDVFEQKPPPLASIAKHDVGDESNSLSVQSLQRRLGGEFSPACLEHISSVLQYSSPSSLGSSQMSATHINSWKSSRLLSHRQSSPSNVPVIGESVDGQNRPLSDLAAFGLSKGQQNIWDELVDESKVSASTPGATVLPDSTFICAIHRQCCKSPIATKDDPSQDICNMCGFTRAHRLLRHGIMNLTDLSLQPGRVIYHMDQQDYFNNTPLHCAAASGHVLILRHAIEAASLSSIYATNTSGETFLHLLCCRTLEEVEIFTQILMNRDIKYLCHFAARDYHGRTILHRLFQSAPDDLFNPKLLRIIFDMTALDIHSADNSGATLLEMVMERASSIADLSLSAFVKCEVESSLYYQGIPVLSTTGKPGVFKDNGMPCFSYRLILSDPSFFSSCHLQHQYLISMLNAGMDINWVDCEGDTPLAAIIKYWMDDDAELLLGVVVRKILDLGSEIHMRDRNGNTSLAAATARGFRAVVKILLDEGANVHNRNYAGVGILTQASRWKRSAKRQKNDKLHARIWSSSLLLIDGGARLDPTGLDEWMSPDGKVEFSRGASIVSTGSRSAPISISKRILQN
jgi:hypothetical protein